MNFHKNNTLEDPPMTSRSLHRTTLALAMGAALRGTGHFKPGMIVSTSTVILNMLLAPVLIFGWGTGHAFGVARRRGG